MSVAELGPAADELGRLSVGQLGARVILDQLDRVERHEAGARAGADPEELHKMRVATRRMRVAFSVFEKALAEEGLRATELPVAEVKVVADALGLVRDLDVFVAWLEEQAKKWGRKSDEAAAVGRLQRERNGRREGAQTAMREVLDGPAPAALRGELRTRLEEIAYRAPEAAGKGIRKKARVSQAGRRLMERARRRLEKRGAALFAPVPEELHEVRIAAKRFRYVCEFVRPAMEERGGQIDEAIKRATAIQDALGEVHDSEAAETALLDDVVRLGAEGAAQDAATIARLAKAQLARGEAALLRFREEWNERPRGGWLKKATGNDDGAMDSGSDSGSEGTNRGDDDDER